VGAILEEFDRPGERLAEARPAAAMLVFRAAVEERVAARRTAVGALVPHGVVRAGEGPVGGSLAQDRILLRREDRPPLLFRLRDRRQAGFARRLVCHGPNLLSRRPARSIDWATGAILAGLAAVARNACGLQVQRLAGRSILNCLYGPAPGGAP